MKNLYKYLILLSFCLLVLILLLWQIWGRGESVAINPLPLPFVEKPQETVVEEPISCEIDDDCRVDEAVVHCPAEARCVENFCQVYCVYDDVNDLEPFSVSECKEDINPLDVRPEEYQTKWLNATDLRISFDIVLACNIDNLSGSYELDDHNKITLNYEYQVKEAAGPCLCVRQLKYRLPNLDDKMTYEIKINKIEK
ncbi:MAG TPA: hypothetical protein PL066_03905 [bacterium]|nr:hypothetical protein [bacterium]